MSKFGKRNRKSQDDFGLYDDEVSNREPSYDSYDRTGRPKRSCILSGALMVALVGAIGTIIVAYLNSIAPLKLSTSYTQTAAFETLLITHPTVPIGTVMFSPTTPPTEVLRGRLEGILTDRTGNPISDLSVSISNGPATKTDIEGTFVLNDVQPGDRLIIVKPPSGDGQFTLNVLVIAEQTNTINIVYDAASSRLGLLSIVAPVDGGDLEIRQDIGSNNEIVHRATIFGRCDGLAQIFQNEFDVWVLVTSERDGRFWVQFPVATIDPNDNTWRANIVFGDAQHPPLNGEMWTIVAVAAESDSGLDKILNTPKLSLLPPHITSNVVSIKSQIR